MTIHVGLINTLNSFLLYSVADAARVFTESTKPSYFTVLVFYFSIALITIAVTIYISTIEVEVDRYRRTPFADRLY